MVDYEPTIDLMKLLIKIKYFLMQKLKIFDDGDYYKQFKDEALEAIENHCRLNRSMLIGDTNEKEE